MGVCSSQASSQEVRGSTRKDRHATADFADVMLLGGDLKGDRMSASRPRDPCGVLDRPARTAMQPETSAM